MNVDVQIKPKTSIIIIQPPAFDLAQLAKYEPNELVTKVPLPPFPQVEQLNMTGDKYQLKALLDASIAAQKQIKADGNVEPERMEFDQLVAKKPNYFGAISEATDPQKIKQAVQQLPQLASASLLPQFEIDPDWLIPVQPIKYNTSYEQMTCVGLDTDRDLLEAVIPNITGKLKSCNIENIVRVKAV